MSDLTGQVGRQDPADGSCTPRRHWARDRRNSARRAARRCLAAIDECLNQLEEKHLAGHCLRRQRACQDLVGELVATCGEKPPRPVEAARTSYALHAALLDWESSLLDRIIPHRREIFPDLEQEAETWKVPKPKRRNRESPSAPSFAGAG